MTNYSELLVAILIATITYPVVTLLNGFLNRRKIANEAADVISHASGQAVAVLQDSITHLELELKRSRDRSDELEREIAKVVLDLAESRKLNKQLQEEIAALRHELTRLGDRYEQR